MPETEKAKVGTRKGPSGRGTRLLFRSSTADILVAIGSELDQDLISSPAPSGALYYCVFSHELIDIIDRRPVTRIYQIRIEDPLRHKPHSDTPWKDITNHSERKRCEVLDITTDVHEADQAR